MTDRSDNGILSSRREHNNNAIKNHIRTNSPPTFSQNDPANIHRVCTKDTE